MIQIEQEIVDVLRSARVEPPQDGRSWIPLPAGRALVCIVFENPQNAHEFIVKMGQRP